MVYMDAHQLLPDGLDQHGCNHRGIHAAGKRQEDLFISHLLTDQLHLVLNEILHVPVGLCLTCLKKEGLHGRIVRKLLVLCLTF